MRLHVDGPRSMPKRRRGPSATFPKCSEVVADLCVENQADPLKLGKGPGQDLKEIRKSSKHFRCSTPIAWKAPVQFGEFTKCLC